MAIQPVRRSHPRRLYDQPADGQERFLVARRRILPQGLEAWFTFLIEHLWSKGRIMEVYLNVAETGLGTYGVEAGAQRYFDHSAAALSPVEAARLAAILPLPKKRAAKSPSGFTLRYGNAIRRRAGVVQRGGLARCVLG